MYLLIRQRRNDLLASRLCTLRRVFLDVESITHVTEYTRLILRCTAANTLRQLSVQTTYLKGEFRLVFTCE